MEKYGVIGFVVITDDIENLSNEACNRLDCGDIVLKVTGNQKHAYRVSYKEPKVGMCITYVDASCVETVSYDYSTETSSWVFNSKDVTPLGD